MASNWLVSPALPSVAGGCNGGWAGKSVHGSGGQWWSVAGSCLLCSRINMQWI